jgi:hypothetical protein
MKYRSGNRFELRRDKMTEEERSLLDKARETAAGVTEAAAERVEPPAGHIGALASTRRTAASIEEAGSTAVAPESVAPESEPTARKKTTARRKPAARKKTTARRKPTRRR